MNSSRAFLLPLLVSALVLGTTGSLSAQTITTTVATTGTTQDSETFNLQTNGPTDWVQFGVSGSAEGFSLTNEKSGGSVGGLDTVGAVTESDDSYAGQTEESQNIEIAYSNGTSPTANTSAVTSGPNFKSGKTAGAWNIQTGFLNEGVGVIQNGATLSFTIDFNQAISSGVISLAGDSFGVTDAVLTASLSNGNTTTTMTGNTVNEENDIFTFDVSNLTAGSSLTLSWDMVAGNPTTDSTGTYDDLALSGVALDLTEAPEPSTYAMMFGGLAILCGVLRFRRHFIHGVATGALDDAK